jgi:hypothetical protein
MPLATFQAASGFPATCKLTPDVRASRQSIVEACRSSSQNQSGLSSSLNYSLSYKVLSRITLAEKFCSLVLSAAGWRAFQPSAIL